MENNFIPTFNMDFLQQQATHVSQQRKQAKRANAAQTANDSGDDSAEGRKKRFQVKIACIHCKKACKKCDDIRPCTRCVRIGFQNNCIDAPRKERKKGFKRGPYNKGRGDGSYEEWQGINAYFILFTLPY